MFGLFKRRKAAAKNAGPAGKSAAGDLPSLEIDGTPDPEALEKARRALATGTARAQIRRTVGGAGDRQSAEAIRRLLNGDG